MNISLSRGLGVLALLIALASYAVDGPLLLVSVILLAIAVIVDNH